MSDLLDFEKRARKKATKLLNFAVAARLESLSSLAKATFSAPSAFVSLADDCAERLSKTGNANAPNTDNGLAFCNAVMAQQGPLLITDVSKDPKYKGLSIVADAPNVRFYAGAPVLVGGLVVGAVNVLDARPRTFSELEIAHLSTLADMAATLLKASQSNQNAPQEKPTAASDPATSNLLGEVPDNFVDLILENIPDPVFVKDAQLRHIQGNAAFFNLFPEDMKDGVIGSTGFEEIVDPKEVDAFQAKDKEAFEHGRSEATETITIGDGEPRIYQTKKIRFEAHDGQPYLIGIARDITVSKQAERRLAEAREFQNLIFDHIPDLVFVKDEEFRIVEANQNFLNVYPEDMRGTVIGTTTIEHYNEEERNAFLEQDRKALAHGVAETEESIDFPDGKRRVLLTKKVRFEDQEQQPFVLGLGRDITELVEVRRQHQASLDLLNSVFDTVTGAVIGLDAHRQVRSINNAGREILAEPERETPFQWPDEITFLDPEDMQPLEASLDPVARALVGQTIGGEVHLMTRKSSSTHRYVRVTSALVRSDSSPLESVIVLDDVSEAERNRQQVERQSRLDALGQLTGGIAHDFNNLLNTMQYALELIRRDELSERGQRSAVAALKSIARGSELTTRLLAFAKKQPSRASARSIEEIFRELSSLAKPAIEASLSVEFQSDDQGLMVFCDHGQLLNAVLNLILNSRDAILQSNVGHQIRINVRAVDSLPTANELNEQSEAVYPAEGRISQQEEDEARADGLAQRYVEIAVSDNGPGMSKAVAARALDPFFTTKGVNSGTGLGLSMVYGFVQQSDGELRIYTEESKGTTVKLYLPRGDEVTGLEEPMALAPLIPGKGETILLVEDEEFLLDQFAALLQELDYTVETAKSGRDAIAMIEGGLRPDLMVTDIVMPGGVGGFQLAKLAREIMATLPIIYMSGYTGFTDEEMGDVIAPLMPKPTSPAMASAQIRAVLDAAQNQQQN